MGEGLINVTNRLVGLRASLVPIALWLFKSIESFELGHGNFRHDQSGCSHGYWPDLAS